MKRVRHQIISRLIVKRAVKYYICNSQIYAPVAQLDRASGYGPEG